MTYRGVKPIIKKSTINVIGTLAFIRASRIMFQKICNYLSILSTVLVLGILGGGFFTFKYVTSDQFKNKMLNEVLGSVNSLMPDMINDQLPKMTAPATPSLIKLPETKFK